MKFQTYTDGGARGNPGPAAIGAVVQNLDTGEQYDIQKYIGETTNNQAEYKALIAALEKVMELGGTTVDCYLDSELVVKQMKREYRVKDQGLAPLFLKAWNLSAGFQKIAFHHVPRALNKAADALVNQALDERL